MEESKMKNMVVLKNLPSNIVEEAIIILKNSKKIKNFQTLEKKEAKQKKSKNKNEDYILKEAEMLLNEYINKMENKKKKEKTNKNIKSKYKKLKIYSVIVTIIAIIGVII